MAFRINAGSSSNPLVQRLLRLMAVQTTTYGTTYLADWNNRDQPDAQHADILSKTFSVQDWESIRTTHTARDSWLMDVIIHDLITGKAVMAVFRVPRL